MKRLLLPFALLLVTAFGCADDEGNSCNVDDDCSGSLVCGQIAICAEPGTCIGVCADPCDTDDDCPGESTCFTEPGGGRTWCRSSDVRP